jgi:phage terminase large subunit
MQGQQVKVAELTIEQKKYLTSFYGFGREMLRLPIYDGRRLGPDFSVHAGNGKILYTVNGAPDWQKRLLDAADKHNSRISARTCNGAGKTNVIIPTLTLTHLSVFPNSRVVITSGGQRQVKDQIFPALKAHEAKFRDWQFQDMRIIAPNGSVCIGFSTDEGGKFEGWHGNKEELYALSDAQRKELEARFQAQLAELVEFMTSGKGPLMIIVDEAKSVRKEIFDAIERCTFQRLVELSSCGPAEGEFYESHHGKASIYTALIHAPASECPHADHAKNVTLIETRGEQDPLVQSKVFANFMTKPGDTVMNRAEVDALMANPPEHKDDGDRKYMCDFAAGGAENVFGERKGNRLSIRAAWREQDTMRACGQFILYFREAGLSPDDAWMIHGDNSGIGKVIMDRLAEMGWHLTRVNNGSPAGEKSAYVNLSAEAWWECGKEIGRRKWILPRDPVLAAQLSTRKPEFNGDKLGVESKEDMAKRGVESPDRADAIVELTRPVRALRPQTWAKDSTPFEQFEAMENRQVPAGFGEWAGG